MAAVSSSPSSLDLSTLSFQQFLQIVSGTIYPLSSGPESWVDLKKEGGEILRATVIGPGDVDASGIPHSGVVTGFAVFTETGEFVLSFYRVRMEMQHFLDFLPSASPQELVSHLLAGADSLWGGGGDDTLLAGDGDDLVLSLNGDDWADGGAGRDNIYGNEGQDLLVGGGGDDNLDGGAGDDTLLGGEGYDNLSGGPGDDYLDGGPGGQDHVSYYYAAGGVHVDLGVAGAQDIGGGEGRDTLLNLHSVFGSLHADTLSGGDAGAVLQGSDGGDLLSGGSGEDALHGDQGDDNLSGGGGNDHLDGGAGDDNLYGGDGDDRLGGAAGTDTLDGGAGVDTAFFYGGSGEGVRVQLGLSSPQDVGGGLGTKTLLSIENVDGTEFGDTLIGDGGENRLGGGSGDDRLQGQNGDDTVNGMNGNDVLEGGDGDDWLDGGRDADRLAGGKGDDTLIGGAGDDTLTGGGGDDLFLYRPTSNNGLRSGGHDVIVDFGRGDDSIDFQSINLKGAGVAFDVVDAFTSSSGQMIITRQADGYRVDADVDGDASADVILEIITTKTLTISDFVF